MNWNQINLTEVFNGVMVVAALALAWISRRIGAKSTDPPTETHTAEIAGAIIDNSSADRVSRAVQANTEAATELVRALDRNTATNEDVTRSVDQLSRDVRDLTQETIRKGG